MLQGSAAGVDRRLLMERHKRQDTNLALTGSTEADLEAEGYLSQFQMGPEL